MYHLLQEFKGLYFYHAVFYVSRVGLKENNVYVSLPKGHSCRLQSLMVVTTTVAVHC